MNYILAVSGGVDSVVLLDMIVRGVLNNIPLGTRSRPLGQAHGLKKNVAKHFIVAHFDHGIRPNSGGDAEFVEKLAKKYQVRFELGEGRLGPRASEEEARAARYKFFRELQKKYATAKIITAHHQDDLLETVVMNLIRGTGWRGLAPMNSTLERPLLGLSKSELVEYAIRHNLDWVEDETNYSNQYFRNRIRGFLLKITPEQRQNLLILNAKQQFLREQIERILVDVANKSSLTREFLLKIPTKSAVEVLRIWTYEKLTEKQTKKLLKDIKNANGGIDLQPGGGLEIRLRRSKLEKKLLKTIAKQLYL